MNSNTTSVFSEVPKQYGKALDANVDAKSIYPGGFLNFGYWESIQLDGTVSIEERVETQRELYRRTIRSLSIDHSDCALEIGCGRGHGTALVFEEFQPGKIHGVDAVPEQIERARTENQTSLTNSNGRLSYDLGVADSLPYPDQYFTKIFSIEAIPHFPNIDNFISEVFRVSRQPGRVAFTTWLASTADDRLKQIYSLVNDDGSPEFHTGHPVAAVERSMSDHGFKEISVTSIGANVWRGYQSWLLKTDPEQKGKIGDFLFFYEQGLLDYYHISASL